MISAFFYCRFPWRQSDIRRQKLSRRSVCHAPTQSVLHKRYCRTDCRVSGWFELSYSPTVKQRIVEYNGICENGSKYSWALKALPKLRSFDGLNIEEIRNSLTTLFTEKTGQKICEYFADKAKLSSRMLWWIWFKASLCHTHIAWWASRRSSFEGKYI